MNIWSVYEDDNDDEQELSSSGLMMLDGGAVSQRVFQGDYSARWAKTSQPYAGLNQ